MERYCGRCGLEFEREPGYWVGAVTINTIVIFVTFLVVFGGSVVLTWPDVPWATVLILTVVANVLIPTFFYPMSKTVWLALEMGWHHLEPEEIEAADARARQDGSVGYSPESG
jgi:Na+(H+)/acetate symporter ActP